MAVVVKEDVIAGSSATSNLRNGEERVRIFTVSGVVGDGHEKYNNVLNAKEIPENGAPHPSVDDIVVKNRTCIPKATDIVEIAVRYAPPDASIPTKNQVILNFSGGLTQTETNLDVNGNVIHTMYTYPDNYSETPELAGETLTHSAMVTKLIPTPRISIQRLENVHPLALTVIYVGRINQREFLFGNPGTWMCVDISGDSQNNGKSWNNTYTFEFRYDGWNQQVVFISSDLGEPPVFDTPQELELGVREYQIYPFANFNNLRFGLID